MTAVALQEERTALINALSNMMEKCESATFADILHRAIVNIKQARPNSIHGKRLSDAELEQLLANEPSFDESK